MMNSKKLSTTNLLQQSIVNHWNDLNQDTTEKSSWGMVKQKAIGQFESIGLPTKSTDLFSFVDIQQLATMSFLKKDILLSDEDQIRINKKLDELRLLDEPCNQFVFVNGYFDPQLSQIQFDLTKLRWMSFFGARQQDKKESPLYQSDLSLEKDPFVLLNHAFCDESWHLRIPKNQQVDSTIHFIFFSVGQHHGLEWSALHPNLFIELDEGAKARVLLESVNLDSNYFCNSYYRIMMDCNSSLDLYCVENSSLKHWNFSKIKATLEKNTTLNHYSLAVGSDLSRETVDIELKGKSSVYDFKSLAPMTFKNRLHTVVRVFHEIEQTKSIQTIRRVLAQCSDSSMDNMVIVKPFAKGCNSSQQIRNLLLSDECQCDNKPNLMIFNDDVQCAHGVTVSCISEDILWYLMSRSLSYNQAKKLIISSFMKELINITGVDSIRTKMQTLIQSMLKDELE